MAPTAKHVMSKTEHAPAAINYSTKAPRYQALDAWRGVACLLMVVFHATMQMTAWYQTVPAEADSLDRAGQTLIMATARTWIGVPIFFVISGYCIMATLDSRRRQEEGLGEYFSRRFWRIYPPYWIALSVSVIAIWLSESYGAPGMFHGGRFTVPNPWEMSLDQWFGNLTLTESWLPLVRGTENGGDRMTNLLPNTWTLCYEEQFYFVAGLVLWLAPRRIFLSLGLITVATVIIKAVAHRAGIDLFGTFLDGRWVVLAAGIAVYYRVNYATRWQGHLIHLTLLAGITANFFGPGRLLDWEPTKDLERLAGFSFALVISLAYQWDRQLMATGIARMFAWVGGMSYSVYLIHPLVTKGLSYQLFRSGYRNPWFTIAVVVPACLVLSLLASRVFYHFVEKPFSNPTSDVKQSKKPVAVKIPELVGTPALSH
jgi:peptidoglycan/LPS O-acetylase OafA/YrhL